MAALTKDRNCGAKYTSRVISCGVAAGAKIFAGAQVSSNLAGYLIPADKTTAGQVVMGRSAEYVDNSAGANGDLDCLVEKGVFGMINDANAVTQADIGHVCYVVDDQTVADETEGSAIIAGIVDSIDVSGKIWVMTLDLDAGGAFASSSIETVLVGAISVLCRTSLISVTGPKAYTLPDGIFEGQRKSLLCSAVSASPAGTITPANYADGTSEHMASVGERLELEWHKASGWHKAENLLSYAAPETVTDGALSLFTRVSLISCADTKAYSLANGLFVGQRKSVIVSAVSGTPIATLTPATTPDAATYVFVAVGERLELEWVGPTGWKQLSSELCMGSTETVASGPISVYTRLSVMTTAGAQAYQLADGIFVGQRKTIRCGATNNTGTITPVSPVGYATLALDAVQEFVELWWNGAAWELLSSLCTIA